VIAGKAFSTFFIVPNQAELLAGTRPIVKNYFVYALSGMKEEPLAFLDKEAQPLPESGRNMWCTGPFLHAAGRQICKSADGTWTSRSSKETEKNNPAVEVFRFEPIRITSVWKDQDGKRVPVFHEASENASTPIQVFRYTHPDYNVIMTSVLAKLLETL
jgi:hypothetical protein